MHPFPHVYRAQANGSDSGPVEVASEGLPVIATWPPPEFDGPEGQWSPETLLLASIADCFVLSFRAVARASKLEWVRLTVDVEGVLERVEGVTRFTKFRIVPALQLAHEQDEARAPAVLDKSKRVCLVTNSLSAECVLEMPVPVPATAGV